MIDALLIITVVGLVYYLWRQNAKKFNFFKVRGIPYIKGYPMVGSMWKLLFQLETFGDFMLGICSDYKDKPLFGIFSLVGPTYVVQDIEMIKQIAIKEVDSFTNRPQQVVSQHKADSLFTKSLLGLQDSKWKVMRSNVSPAFTSSKMRIMFDLVKESTDDLISYFNEKLRSDGRVEVATKDIFAKVAVNSIATAAMGVKVDSLREPNNPICAAAMKIVKNFTQLSWRLIFVNAFPRLANMLDLSLFDQESSEFFKQLVNDTITERQKKNIYRPDVIQLLMAEVAKMSNDELTAQVFIFFLGGFEPVSTFLQFAVYDLAVNQDAQEKLHEEIQQVKQSLDGKPITYDTLNQMEYLEAFMNEVLRKKTGFLVERACNADVVIADSEGKKHKIEKGTNVMFPSYSLHHDQRYFPNPEKFDPDRFLGEQNKDVAIAFLPFGLGLRNCIGMRFALMEAKIVLYSIVSEFLIEPNEKTLIPFRWKHGFTNLPAKPLMVDLKKR